MEGLPAEEKKAFGFPSQDSALSVKIQAALWAGEPDTICPAIIAPDSFHIKHRNYCNCRNNYTPYSWPLYLHPILLWSGHSSPLAIIVRHVSFYYLNACKISSPLQKEVSSKNHPKPFEPADPTQVRDRSPPFAEA